MRTPLITSLAVAAALAVPAVASADSIVYIDGGNVWSASPDGARKVQLTDGGGWHSPTQADDGTIAAVQGTGPIQVMANDGRPIRSITTKPARTGNGGTFAPRPLDLSFSPDGSKIAYSYVAFSCPPASTCTDQESTFYTRADVSEATPQEVWGNQFSVSNPEWITNDRVLLSNGSRVAIDDLDAGDYNHQAWIQPGEDINDAEVSRDGRRLATTFFYGKETIIAFWSVNGDVKRKGEVPPRPDAACNTNEDEELADPSWSPDGTGMAFQDKDGIQVYRFSEIAPNRCTVTGPAVLSPTGQSPDWGPADPPAARFVPPVAPLPVAPATNPAPAIGKGTTTGTGTSQPGAKPAAVKFVTPKATRAALRRGLAVKVTAPGAGLVKVALTAKGTTVASGTFRARRAGAVTVKLSKVTRRRAARLKGKTLRLTLTAGKATSSRTLKVR